MEIGSQSLPFIVRCKSLQPFFETIAAFNCRPAADGYAGECRTANPTFEYQVAVNAASKLPREEIEKEAARLVIEGALQQGCTVSVWNGGEDAEISKSGDLDAIVKELMASDSDELVFHREGKKVGWVHLVYGNSGHDVISDYTCNVITETAIDRAEAFCMKQEELGA